MQSEEIKLVHVVSVIILASALIQFGQNHGYRKYHVGWNIVAHDVINGDALIIP